MKNLLCALLLVFFFACDGSKEEMLPSATGISGDVYLIMDSAQYKGPLGALIDSVFRSEYLVINRPEPLFKMHWVDPRKLNYTLKLRRNLIYAVTLDQSGTGANRVERMLTAESINKIKADTSFFFKAVTNQFAKGQQTFFLVGAREELLTKKIRKNAARLVAALNKSEQERLTQQLLKAGSLKGLNEKVFLMIRTLRNHENENHETVYFENIHPDFVSEITLTNVQFKYSEKSAFKLIINKLEIKPGEYVEIGRAHV